MIRKIIESFKSRNAADHGAVEGYRVRYARHEKNKRAVRKDEGAGWRG
jgi:hypothetical protein